MQVLLSGNALYVRTSGFSSTLQQREPCQSRMDRRGGIEFKGPYAVAGAAHASVTCHNQSYYDFTRACSCNLLQGHRSRARFDSVAMRCRDREVLSAPAAIHDQAKAGVI
jgi:hypothetical protein